MIKLLPILILSLLYLCGCSDSNKKGRQIPKNDIPPFEVLSYPNISASEKFYESHIFPEEVRDTTFTIKRESGTTLLHIFKELVPIQRKGRSEYYEYDSYQRKVDGSYDPTHLFQTLINEKLRDTLYLIEYIGRDGSYGMTLWLKSNKNKAYDISYSGNVRPFNIDTTKNQEFYKEYRHIMSWQKNELKEYGCCEEHEGILMADQSTRCVSRITLSPDAIVIDMIKYYQPLWPDERAEQSAQISR